MAIEQIRVVIPVDTGTITPDEFTQQAMNYANQASTYKNQALASETACANSVTLCASAASQLTELDIFKPQGVIDCSVNPNFPTSVTGDYYIVSVAGKIGGVSGIEVRSGDMIVALETSASGNFATVGTSWMHINTNLDGVVIGPSSSTVDYVPTFNATNGKLIKDSGVPISDVARNSSLGNLSTISHPNDASKVLYGDGVFRTSSSLTLNDVLPYIIALGD